ncbi:MAG TPA: hypothetical protein VFG55_06940 [Rhodanobacteraceae bacterium]|nr:hypothetical protein [Rhodanobacteraceae bacterium]
MRGGPGVSDVSCPWCAIGLNALLQAIDRVGDEAIVDLHFQPFELNPQLPPAGQDATEHLVRKYGSTPEQVARNREVIRAREAELGFVFNRRERVYNTFDAHRLVNDRHLISGGQPVDVFEDALRRIASST